MDKVKALEIESQLQGNVLQEWQIINLINFGKSAAVFYAKNVHSDSFVAIKIFDDELIEKYGDAAQLKRISRELELIGKSHPNMVKILGGGFDPVTGNHFIVMEYISGKNIKDCLDKIPMDNVPALVSQLADCCEYLECLGLAHRDIKPENIVISDDFSRLTLLDFGVVRPFGRGDITDDNGVQSFVGTLQYSSPEFLLRQEEDSIDGWRAHTFYQIAAVMHDLIMRKPIFADNVQPYARLVNAVQHNTPTIDSTAVPSYLIETAKLGLMKDFRQRLNHLTWRSFHPPEPSLDTLTALRERVSRRSSIMGDSSSESVMQSTDAVVALIEDVVSHLKVKARAIRTANRSAFPPINISREGDILCIGFDRSPPHSLHGNLRIWLEVQVIDSEVGLVAILAKGLLTKKDAPPPDKHVPIFIGLSSSGDLTVALERVLYEAIDQAQSVDTSNDDIVLELTPFTSEAAHV
ncbi:protein kinase [Tabrizicola sp.]|uniref:protein kinase domain-containing protein n=1 Tax=Tabrizicola sp. TaxID=2005166 RepID=UPI002732A756|nr:protein kinase [Tabrizicola sp.]MDP3194334.1 protein kinase [Tabrizicola sp.]